MTRFSPHFTTRDTPTRTQGGNVLWFILLAIGLLAALTMVITKSGENVQQDGAGERATIDASSIIRAGKTAEVAIQTMLSRGVSQGDVCFDDPAWGHNDYNFSACSDSSNRVFGVGGGGLTVPRAASGQVFSYTGSVAINGVGTSEPELVFIASGIDRNSCLKINRMVEIPDASGNPPSISTTVPFTKFTGTYTSGTTLSAPGNLRKSAGCVGGSGSGSNTLSSDTYHYYHVLVPR